MLYRPFHTTAESRSERQPLLFAGQRLITWDGRLDNRDDLLQQLADRVAAYSPDVAIVAAAFERWGTNCFNRLVGDWALSLWDSIDNALVLARDYIGIRQLFYHLKTNELIWCTNLDPLVQCGDTFTLCDEYVAGYLAFKPDARLTPYRELRSVPPGGFVRVRNRTVTAHTYWTINPHLRTHYKTDEEYQEHYFHLLRQSVRRRLRSDRPILAALSGGLDSTSIVCMADHIRSEEQIATPRIDTVSYYDPLEPDEDDPYHLTKVEQQRGRKGFHLSLPGMGDSLSFEYPAFVATPGFGIRAEVKVAMSSLVHESGYRVLLSGTGGDEMNAQALSPVVAMADLFARFHFSAGWKQLVAWSLATRKPLIQLLFQTLLELLPLRIRARFGSQGKLQPWVNREFARKHQIRARQLENVPGFWFWRPGPRDAAQTITTLSREFTYALPSHLEQRYPYLDQTLAEFLTTIPFEQLLQPWERRRLMRRTLEGLIPEEVLHRKTKVSAVRCYPITLEKHWCQIEDGLSSSLSSKLGYTDSKELRKDLVQLRNGQIPLHLVRLLKALSLEFWLRDVQDRGIVRVCNQSPA
ncbi:MAG: asparagine synthetase B family protein [Terriglobales bacterium]